MKILFGIQGTGNGHLSRCYRIANELQQYDVEVDYLISGRKPGKLFNMEMFGDFQTRRGLSFYTQEGKVRPIKTALNNSLWAFYQEVKNLDVSGYDLVVSDFEPVTAWAARRNGKRCIGIGRQYAFKEETLYRRLNVFQRMIIDFFAPANEWLGMHWNPIGGCLPPVVRDHEQDSPNKKQVLVYLPFENLYRVVDALLPHQDYSFSVFHPDIKTTKYFASDHIMGFPPSRTTFAEQLSVASGVMSNAGFETTCEALNRAKHLAVKPLQGQFEQIWNAKLLSDEGLANVLTHVTEDSVGQWLAKIDGATTPKPLQWSNVANEIAQWLATGAQQKKHNIREKLWSGSPGWIRTNDTWINSPPL